MNGKSFTIRNVDTTAISSCDDLKLIIREQLNDDIAVEDFYIGLEAGASVVRTENTRKQVV